MGKLYMEEPLIKPLAKLYAKFCAKLYAKLHAKLLIKYWLLRKLNVNSSIRLELL